MFNKGDLVQSIEPITWSTDETTPNYVYLQFGIEKHKIEKRDLHFFKTIVTRTNDNQMTEYLLGEVVSIVDMKNVGFCHLPEYVKSFVAMTDIIYGIKCGSHVLYYTDQFFKKITN